MKQEAFSIAAVAPAIIVPLRYYFSTYSSPANLVWNEDEKLRTMDIFESTDLNRVPLGELPRVVVTRGDFSIRGVGLSNNLADGASWGEQGGRRRNQNMVFYQGNATVLVEARNKGTCELLADMVMHFIGWTEALLCDTQGWKQFGLPMGVSDCNLAPNENPGMTKFQVSIQVPWMKEEQWVSKTDAPTLKAILTTVTNGSLPG